MTTEQEFTDTLVQEYSRAGWQVENSAIAAEELNFRPDIVLKRGDEILVIEVKRAGFVDKRAISRIKRKVEEKPNWHFELKLIPPSRPLKKSGTIKCEACLDDTPASGKSLGEGGKLCHQPFSAMSFGNRTRF